MEGEREREREREREGEGEERGKEGPHHLPLLLVPLPLSPSIIPAPYS